MTNVHTCFSPRISQFLSLNLESLAYCTCIYTRIFCILLQVMSNAQNRFCNVSETSSAESLVALSGVCVVLCCVLLCSRDKQVYEMIMFHLYKKKLYMKHYCFHSFSFRFYLLLACNVYVHGTSYSYFCIQIIFILQMFFFSSFIALS